MRFKEGSRVEVLRKKKEACGSWFPAKILSKVGNVYTVRYELYLSSKGEPVEEKVHEEDVRPCPPPAHGGETWVVGDVAEVFDICAWRVGKVVKVLSNGYVVVRLFNSIQLKKLHVSNLRVRCAWHGNRWISLGKASEKRDAHCSSKYATYLDSGANGVKCEEACTRRKYEHDYVCSFPAGRNDNKNLNVHGSSFPDDVAIRGNSNKRRWILEGGEHHPLAKRALPRKIWSDSFHQSTISISTVSCSIGNTSFSQFEYGAASSTTILLISSACYSDIHDALKIPYTKLYEKLLLMVIGEDMER